MAVQSPRSETEVVRSEQATEFVRQLRNLIRDGPVGKAETLNTRGATPKAFEGNLRFLGPQRRQVVTLSTSSGMGRLAIGDCDHNRLDTDTIHVLEQATCTEDLVVGMRRHDNQPTGTRQAQRWEDRKLLRPEPGSLVSPKVPIVND
jgi:hypothetical protein